MTGFKETIGDSEIIFLSNNHAFYGGLGEYLLNSMIRSETLGI